MRIAIIGSRKYPRLEDVDVAVDGLSPDDVVVSGGARGVDQRARDCAKASGRTYDEFLADWDNEGRVAGMRRNERMLVTVDRVIAFWDGGSRGTKHAIEFARSRGILVDVVRWEPSREDLLAMLNELRRMHSVAAQHEYVLPEATANVLKWLVVEGPNRLGKQPKSS